MVIMAIAAAGRAVGAFMDVFVGVVADVALVEPVESAVRVQMQEKEKRGWSCATYSDYGDYG